MDLSADNKRITRLSAGLFFFLVVRSTKMRNNEKKSSFQHKSSRGQNRRIDEHISKTKMEA